MSPPTILYTTSDASPQSGAFRQVFEMNKHMAELGFRPVLVLPQAPPRSLLDGGSASAVNVMPLPRPRTGRSARQYAGDVIQTARSIRRLSRLIRREHVAVVHVNEILDVYGAVAAKVAGVPCVWHLRADLSSAPTFVQTWLPRIVLALSTKVVSVSASASEHTFRGRGAGSGKVSVIHNPGPDPSVFHPNVDGSSVRRDLGLADDALLVILVAKLSERKGHEVFIRAAPKVLASFPDARFVIVGGELEGEHHRRYARLLRQLPAELGVEEAVVFAGYRGDVPQIMAAADIVTHCSTYPDPFPGVVLQAMASGKPVIASDIGGPREQIEGGTSGILIPPNDPDVLADAICVLLADPDGRARLGQAAALRVASAFTADSFYRQLADLYEQVSHSGQRGDRVGGIA
ncbi:MAG: glycosyltransferase family 4 protein [Actinomycetota bacterium]|nr:glycosyltransferase family 4 protein [Actinomycetota bacterium]